VYKRRIAKILAATVIAAGVPLAALAVAREATELLDGRQEPVTNPGDCRCFGGGDDGGGIPVPYSALNQKVELADREYYTLVGRVIFVENVPFLQVDLAKHPWLANARRNERPLYQLVADSADWVSYEGEWLQVFVQAQGRIVKNELGVFVHDLVLKSVAKPVRYRHDEPPPTQE
jgi:hypothetical protein